MKAVSAEIAGITNTAPSSSISDQPSARPGAIASAGLIANEVRECERDAELERALIEAAPEDLLRLLNSVANGVLVDSQPFGSAAAAGVLVEVGTHGGGESGGEIVVAGSKPVELASDECAGLVEIGGRNRGERDARRSE